MKYFYLLLLFFLSSSFLFAADEDSSSVVTGTVKSVCGIALAVETILLAVPTKKSISPVSGLIKTVSKVYSFFDNVKQLKVTWNGSVYYVTDILDDVYVKIRKRWLSRKIKVKKSDIKEVTNE
jgi:hypothetical protein